MTVGFRTMAHGGARTLTRTAAVLLAAGALTAGASSPIPTAPAYLDHEPTPLLRTYDLGTDWPPAIFHVLVGVEP